MSEKDITLLYDTVLRRPGCVLLQAVAGGDGEAFREFFGGADNWLVSPTPDMKMITGTREQWRKEAARG